MSATVSNFFVTGGTLRSDVRCYVERKADIELFRELAKGNFCYVLTARQMGKSSLMVRAAAKLRQQGMRPAVLDLAAAGQNVSPEQWYQGLITRVGQQLGCEDELEDFWFDNAHLGVLQRWFEAIRQIILVPLLAIPSAKRPKVVIFIDELDMVRSLPFQTDEFFAGIRECYNRRAAEPEFELLTFCLLGVASPSDLIRDSDRTPFQIGHRIELTDFSEREASVLLDGLRQGTAEFPGLAHEAAGPVLKRILYWSNGHPYLTQVLCQTSLQEGISGPAGVDRICEQLFFSVRAVDQDDNLLFVREWIFRSGEDRTSLLRLYRAVHSGEVIADDPKDPLQIVLKLSGLIRARAGQLYVRNRIYHRAFNAHWIASHLPGHGRQRLRVRTPPERWVRHAFALALLLALVTCSVSVMHFFLGLATENVRAETSGAEIRRAQATDLTHRVPPRTAAKPGNLNLTRYYNALLSDPWQDGNSGNHLGMLPSGLQTFGGVAFDVRGLIQMASSTREGQRFPALVEGIPVQKRCSKVHFLHGAIWGHGTQGRNLIGSYVLTFEDGQKWEVPIELGRHVRDWWESSSKLSEPAAPVPVWEGMNPASSRTQRGIRIYMSSWTNPFPHLLITELAIRSGQSTAAPFVIAITTE